MRVNLSIDYFNTVFPEMNFSNKPLYSTTAFISNISLKIVRVIAGIGGTNYIATSTQCCEFAAILFQHAAVISVSVLGSYPSKYGQGELISVSRLNVRALLHTGIYNSFLFQPQS